jgi:tetratricopeptide (TPR) repeat protein/serine phosphatase RsbU (regulator of sigma subunit)
MIPRIFAPLLFLAFSMPAFAQDQKAIDSLTLIAKKNPQDTSSVSAYLELSQATLYSGYDKSFAYAKSGLAVAEKLNDDHWKGRCYNQMGTVCFSYGLSKEAIDNYSNAISILEIKEDSSYWIAKSMNGMGNAQRKMGRTKEATDSYLYAKNIFEKLHDKKGIAGTYNNLGIIFMAEDQQEKALEYFKIARRMNIEINNIPWLAKNLSNMGNAFFNLGQYDSAEVYFNQSMKMCLELNDLGGWATDVSNLGNVYTSKKEYKKAKEQFEIALDFYRNNDQEAEMALSMSNIAGLYTETGDYEIAKQYLDSSVAIGIKYNDLVSLLAAYKSYTVMYEKSGDFENAYKYYSMYATKKDSMISSDMKGQMDQMEESLREEKLKEQNETLEHSKNRSNIISYTAIGGIVLVLLLAFTLFKRYQLKKKANDLLKERNREIQSQKAIIEQKSEEVSDSINYAKKIQDTLLPDLPAFHSAFKNAFIFFRPKNVVSGDFYWFSPSENKTFVAVADCTGHGVPGAFMSVIGIDKLNQAMIEFKGATPSGILASVNRQLKTVLKQDDLTGGMRDGMDIALVAIDHKKMLLEFSGANRPIWIIRNEELIELEPSKASIGGHTPASHEFSLHEFELQRNDCIYLFSDGYADQFGGPKEKKMMTKNFKKILLSLSKEPMDSQKRMIAEKFDRWKNNLEQVDDICVMGICIQ